MLDNESNFQNIVPSLFNEESSLCRLCGSLNQNGAHIFSDEEDTDLSHLINKYLPLRVENNGSYPDKICPGCNIQLEATKIFFDLIIEGQNKLKSIYDEINRLESNGSEIKTFEIQSETGEKFFVQNETLYSEDHGMLKSMNILNVNKQKRGRPRKLKPSHEEKQPQEKEEEKPEPSSVDDGKRARKIPARFLETVQGKELDEIMKKEGIDDDSSKNSLNAKVIGRIENGNGEEIGKPVTVKNSKKMPMNQKFHKKKKMHRCRECLIEFRNYSHFQVHFMKCHKSMDEIQISELNDTESNKKTNDHNELKENNDEQKPEELSGNESLKHCKESFESQTDSDEQFKRTHEDLVCLECKETFSDAKLLETHHKKCHNAWIHICEICHKKFNHHSTLLYHRNSEHNEVRFVCNTCNKPFKHKQLLHRHQLVHTENRPYKCEHCPSAFKTKANLYTHTAIHTGVKNHICEICQQKFSHKTSLNSHMRWHMGEKPYSCEFCSKKFTQKGNLVEHKRIHTGEKPFSCKQCGRKFTTSSQLKLHTRSHTGEKPWSCDICSKKFSFRDSWKEHCRKHLNDQPFKCNLCPKSFTTLCRLKKHSIFHSGEKPYTCNICLKGFSDNSNLIKHRKIHDQKAAKEKENLLYVYYGNEDQQNVEIPQQIVETSPDESVINFKSDTMEFQVVDQEGNILSLNTQDGQQINVIATSLTNVEQKLQGILPDGTVVAIDLEDSKVENIQALSNEIEEENVVSHLLLNENVAYLNENVEKTETNTNVMVDQSNICFVTYDSQADVL